VLNCPPGLAWPTHEAEWAGLETPAAVLDIYDSILAVTRDLTPLGDLAQDVYHPSHPALEDLQAQLAGAGQDYHPEWDGADGVIVVRIGDQQLLLSESEQRILEDALLTRLAQQIHDRTDDARDLIRAMNREMRSRKMSSGKTVGGETAARRPSV
jgi:hypothetical protein